MDNFSVTAIWQVAALRVGGDVLFTSSVNQMTYNLKKTGLFY